MKIHSSILSLLLVSFVHAAAQQKVANVDKDEVSPLASPFFLLGGEPFSLVKYVKVVDGSPYFREDWMPGVIVLPHGTRYDSLQLKLDLLANEVHYQDPKGNELITNNEIRELWLNDPATGTIHHFVHASYFDPAVQAPGGWYEQLLAGKAWLFKRIVKQITETKPYSASVAEQRISSVNQYLVLHGKQLTPIKSISAFPPLFPEKRSALEQFIAAEKLKGKSDKDYISLVTYYNGL